MNLLGMMVENTLVTMLMTKNMDMVYLNGLMAENIKGIGRMENNMVKEYILDQMVAREKVNGIMEKELDGLKKIKLQMNKINKIIDEH